MSRKPHAVDASDQARIASAEYFIVSTILGRGRYDRRRADTLDAARALRDAAGKDDQGRRPMIYAVGRDGVSVHVS
jgi:hypothetical protein